MNTPINTKSNNNENIFLTSDLGCSAALLSTGFNLIYTDKQNTQKIVFAFARSKELEAATELYFNGGLQVSARMMFDNIKALKNRIYSN